MFLPNFCLKSRFLDDQCIKGADVSQNNIMNFAKIIQ